MVDAGGGGGLDVALTGLWAADPEPSRTGEHRHFPYARRVRHGWARAVDGHWTWAAEDPRLWEVFCAQCGDADGPAEGQSPEVQRLRGPYPGEHHARRVATRHFREN